MELLIKLYKRKGQRLGLSLIKPFEEKKKSKKEIKNIAHQVLEISDYFKKNPEQSYSKVAEHFGVSKARVSQLLKVANNLPDSFLNKLAQTQKNELLMQFPGRKLIQLASNNINLEIEELLEAS